MSKENRTEGIILKSLEHRDNTRIITLFSRDCGIISLIVKGVSRKNPQKLALTTPLSEVEMVFRKGHSELLAFIDGSILDEHFPLRSSYRSLCAAGELSKSILQSQWPGKPSPALYDLFRAFLKQIPSFDCLPLAPLSLTQETHLTSLMDNDPLSFLTAVFQFKLLIHEGLIALSPHCTQCHQPSCTLYQGESVCALHRPLHTACLPPNLWDLLLTIHFCKQFSQLSTLSRDPLLISYIRKTFLEMF